MRSISAKPVSFTGTMDVNGLLPRLDLGNLNNATVDLGGASSDRPTSITVADASASTIRTNAPVKSLKANSFAAGAAAPAGQISSRGMSKLTVAGDLANAVVINGTLKNITVGGNVTGNVSADIIGSAKIAGNLTDVSFRSIRAFAAGERPMGRITIGGTVSGGLIRAEGNITSVTVGALDRSIIVAGLMPNNSGATLPTQISGYFQSPASIGSVTVKGGYSRSNIVAFALGRINVGTLTTANGGLPFGVGGDRIASLTGSAGAGALTIRNLNDETDVQEQTGGADLEDFQIAAVEEPV
jgi:hypothetical protein